jgi:methionyl-tRNA synthetase
MASYLLTSALPYANGSIHIGHLVEHAQADIQARALRLAGRDVLFVCADDTHGTPVELNARRQGITPQELIARSWDEHVADLLGFGVAYDDYYTTDSPENRALAEHIYRSLRNAGHISRRQSQQFYSESLGRFLPDRMVRGTCPKCGALEQYGDACEVCRSTYEPTELIDPVDAIEGQTPVLRTTEQLYVELEPYAPMLSTWAAEGIPQPAVRAFVQTWMDGGLKAWCISRDAPYFGFEIPDEPGKFFYVWLDAPIGYIAATQHACQKMGRDWKDYWSPEADARVIHVIGKDITYFHTLFWPAMLHAGGFRLPHRVQVHGFLTVDGAKMSKSRGTFIKASTYLKHLDPDWLRFYFAAKLGDAVEDIDLNLTDFVHRVNADLINNLVNLCSRVTKLLAKSFDGRTAAFVPEDYELCLHLRDGRDVVLHAMLAWDYRSAVRHLTELGDAVNEYLQHAEPWKVLRTDPEEAHRITSVALHGAMVLMTLLSPICPGVTQRFAAALGASAMTWAHTHPDALPPTVAAPEMLLGRIDPDAVQRMIEESRTETPTQETGSTTAEPGAPSLEPWKEEIEFPDFARVDLRVGVVREAGLVEGADKLIRLQVDIGRLIQVFAGVRKAYPDPSVLVGRKVVVVANLKPRKMKFGMSEGMLLATSASDDSGLQLLQLDASVGPGWTVR